MVLPMHYRASRANVYFVKQEISRIMRPVYSPGGSSYPFMPMPTLKSLVNGVYVPCVMTISNDDGSRHSKWEAPVSLDGEKFSDVEVDRARVVIPTEPSSLGNLRLKVSRDGYVDKFSYMGQNLIRLVIPRRQDPKFLESDAGLFAPLLGQDDFRGTTVVDGLEWLSTYWTAPMNGPKYAVGVVLPYKTVSYETFYRGGETIIKSGSVERVPIPGETTGKAAPNAVPKSTVDEKPSTTEPAADSEMNSMGGVPPKDRK